MTDAKYRDMVIDHDKHIDSLTTSVAVLADNVSETNKKLDNMLVIINKQNILTERLTNLDSNFRESFKRVHNKIDEIELIQKDSISASVVKWFIGLSLSYAVAFGTYVAKDLNALHIIAESNIQMQNQINKNIEVQIKHLITLEERKQ